MPRQMSKKNLNITKGEPELYDEKKKPLNLAMTPTAAKMLEELASQMELTRSELVERVARGIISLQSDNALTSNDLGEYEGPLKLSSA